MSFFISGFRIALRARYVLISLMVIFVCLGAAFLSSSFSGRQPATVGLDVGLSVLRLLLPLVLVLMTQELVSREFERRYFLSSLSYPRSRTQMLLGRFFALLVLMLGLLLLASFLLAVLISAIGKGYAQATPVSLGWNYSIVIGFFGLDLLLLCAVAFLLAVFASSPSFVLIGTLGFMLVARSFSSVVELLGRSAFVVDDAETYSAGVGLLRYFLPDLGALDIRMVALYDSIAFLPGDWSLLLLSGFIYVLMILAVSVWILGRKRFS